MSVVYKEQVEQVVPTQALNATDYARGVMRLCVCVTWMVACRVGLLIVSPLTLFSRSLSARVRKRISRAWIAGVTRLIGTRITVKGTPPQAPFFIVGNHPTWIDLFAFLTLLDPTPIVEAPLRRVPIVGPLIGGLQPIWIHRRKEDTARVVERVHEAIVEGKSIVIAPETPVTTIVPVGSGVRMFRAGLFEAAVRDHQPVHATSITYRLPAGYSSPSKMLTFGPNPFFLTPEGKIPQSELDAFGPPRSFFPHLLGVLSLPWHECTVTFDPQPYYADDRVTLANMLHDAVKKMFVPFY